MQLDADYVHVYIDYSFWHTQQLDIFCCVTVFTSDFLNFIVVEHIRFFHRAIQLQSPAAERSSTLIVSRYIYDTLLPVAYIQTDDGAVGVFSYLTGRLIEEACEHAIGHGDLHTALLLSRAVGSEDMRHLMLKQLAAWSDTQVS